MSTDFYVSIGGARGEEWERIAGTRRFPVKSPIPFLADLPGQPKAEVFLLDIQELEYDVLVRITAHLCQKFGLTTEEAAVEIKAGWIPILNEDCMVTILNPQRWLLHEDEGSEDPWADDPDEFHEYEFDSEEDWA